jgi:hypothetical protein
MALSIFISNITYTKEFLTYNNWTKIMS